MDMPPVARIGIAGLGLIGASLAAALARAWPGSRRIGHDIAPGVAQQARSTGVVDEIADGQADLLQRCDLVVLCQPVQALIDSLAVAAAAPRLPLLCDVASVKTPVLEAADALLGARRGRFVGAHPIAGKAERGFAAAEGGLFRGRAVVICPAGADDHTVRVVQALWRAVGARPLTMSAPHHDDIYAALSHLPQLLTWAYLGTLAGEPWRGQARSLAGPGFESFTRLGRSDARLWAEIALQNRAPLLERIDGFAGGLEKLRRALALGRPDELAAMFDLARATLDPVPG